MFKKYYVPFSNSNVVKESNLKSVYLLFLMQLLIVCFSVDVDVLLMKTASPILKSLGKSFRH